MFSEEKVVWIGRGNEGNSYVRVEMWRMPRRI